MKIEIANNRIFTHANRISMYLDPESREITIHPCDGSIPIAAYHDRLKHIGPSLSTHGLDTLYLEEWLRDHIDDLIKIAECYRGSEPDCHGNMVGAWDENVIALIGQFDLTLDQAINYAPDTFYPIYED